MKNNFTSGIIIFFLFVSSINFAQQKNTKTVYQTAPIISLIKGVMNDNVTLSEVKKHGDFGLGTFNGVDGEMIELNGIIYRIGNTGKAEIPPDTTKTPFAAVVNFKADKTIEINDTLNFKQINELIDKSLPSLNNIYAIKITGTFKAVKTRSEFKQTKPYNNLGDVLKHQVVFNLGKVQGTMVGFRFPKYLNNVNVSGLSFPFLNK